MTDTPDVEDGCQRRDGADDEAHEGPVVRDRRRLDPETGQGDAHVQYAFSAHRAVVDVDVELGLVKVVALDTAQEEGKAHRYLPLVARERAGRSALSRMVEKLFDGSPELLLTQLVSDRRLSPPEIRRLRKILDQRLKGGAR